MLVGVVVAGLVAWRSALGVVPAFFEGAGYGFTHIISLIVTANCFGEAISQVGLAALVARAIEALPLLLLPTAGLLPLGFAVLCGSGMASTQSLFVFFAEPAVRLGIDPAQVGAVVSLAAAAGRTMSPVAAVTLMCADLTKTNPFDLVKCVSVPLLLGLLAVVVAAIMGAG
jgi:DcuC family C4-dicarboxylate transporter